MASTNTQPLVTDEELALEALAAEETDVSDLIAMDTNAVVHDLRDRVATWLFRSEQQRELTFAPSFDESGVVSSTVPPLMQNRVERPAEVQRVIDRVLSHGGERKVVGITSPSGETPAREHEPNGPGRDGGERATRQAIRGMGGVGKTVLAVLVAHDPRIREHFTGGIYKLQLSAAEQSLRQPLYDFLVGVECSRMFVENAVGEQNEGMFVGNAVGEQNEAQHLRSFSEHQLLLWFGAFFRSNAERKLLIIDDAWRSSQLSPLLSRVGEHCSVLITTRLNSLVRAEHTVILGCMPEAESLRFMQQRLGAEMPPEGSREHQYMISVMQRAGGLPAALDVLCGTVLLGDVGWEQLEARLLESLRKFAQTQNEDGYHWEHMFTFVLEQLRQHSATHAVDRALASRYWRLVLLVEDEAVDNDTLSALWDCSAAEAAGTAEKLVARSLLLSNLPRARNLYEAAPNSLAAVQAANTSTGTQDMQTSFRLHDLHLAYLEDETWVVTKLWYMNTFMLRWASMMLTKPWRGCAAESQVLVTCLVAGYTIAAWLLVGLATTYVGAVVGPELWVTAVGDTIVLLTLFAPLGIAIAALPICAVVYLVTCWNKDAAGLALAVTTLVLIMPLFVLSWPMWPLLYAFPVLFSMSVPPPKIPDEEWVQTFALGIAGSIIFGIPVVIGGAVCVVSLIIHGYSSGAVAWLCCACALRLVLSLAPFPTESFQEYVVPIFAFPWNLILSGGLAVCEAVFGKYDDDDDNCACKDCPPWCWTRLFFGAGLSQMLFIVNVVALLLIFSYSPVNSCGDACA